MFRLFYATIFVCCTFLATAQTNETIKNQHKAANERIQQLYPDAKKVDLDALNKIQKKENKKCSSCPYQKTSTATAPVQQKRSEATLQADKNRLEQLLLQAKNQQQPSEALIQKYEKALEINRQQLILVQSQKQVAAKKARQH